jgi:hypothetical protein
METVIIVVLAVVAIGALIALAVTLRRTPTIGQGEMPESPRPHAEVHGGMSIHGEPAAGRDLGLPAGEKGRIIAKHTVTTRRIVVGGHNSDSISVDGKSYRSFDEIPDPATREAVRSALSTAESEIKDPKLQELLREELEGLGVEPPADPSPPALNAGTSDQPTETPPGSS